jgi:GNAT superfamily N-acetyltransferase
MTAPGPSGAVAPTPPWSPEPRSIEIRLATLADVPILPEIERDSAEAFRGSSQDAIADDAVTPASFYPPKVAKGLVWVAEDAGEIIGFAACGAFQDALHLWEIAVRHDRQGRGAGRALIAAVTANARVRGLPSVTLTTFRDIPWNGPFYGRLGFVELDMLNPRLAAVIAREARHGLDIAARCAMRLAL